MPEKTKHKNDHQPPRFLLKKYGYFVLVMHILLWGVRAIATPEFEDNWILSFDLINHLNILHIQFVILTYMPLVLLPLYMFVRDVIGNPVRIEFNFAVIVLHIVCGCGLIFLSWMPYNTQTHSSYTLENDRTYTTLLWNNYFPRRYTVYESGGDLIGYHALHRGELNFGMVLDCLDPGCQPKDIDVIATNNRIEILVGDWLDFIYEVPD